MREIEIRKRTSRYFLPAALLRAAHLAFIASESFFLPAAVSPPFFFPLALAAPPAVPLRLAQRALAAAASFARVAADIGRRRRRRRRVTLPPPVELLAPPPPKSVDNRRSSELICCLIERASDSLLRDRSMGPR